MEIKTPFRTFVTERRCKIEVTDKKGNKKIEIQKVPVIVKTKLIPGHRAII